MPNIKSAIKRVSTTLKKTIANKIKKSEIRSVVKKTRAAVAASADQAGEQVKIAQARLDKAAVKGFIHKNTAARRKSRLAKALKAIKK
jgi:small subunit ribosomal protein S20